MMSWQWIYCCCSAWTWGWQKWAVDGSVSCQPSDRWWQSTGEAV